MTLVRTTATAALAYGLSLQGRSRLLGTATWTPDRNIDDCARFCSHLLWGGNPGPISWVDNFKSASDGTYHAGKSGLAPGDVVLFDWEGNRVGNHVEMCLTSPNSLGAFTTIGANGSDTVAAKVRGRNPYVMGYFRPAWGSASPTPAQPNPQEGTVTARQFRNKKTGEIAAIDPNGVQDFHVPNMDYVNLNTAIGVTSGPVVDLDDNVFGYVRMLATLNTDRVGKSAARQTWQEPVTGWNGAQTAGTRLQGIDQKADVVNPASTADIVAKVSARATTGGVDTDALATSTAAKTVAALRALFIGK